jgi:D-alanyl-lipoteichoic acid acyltransferase DltB (MBOAT superfamily)
MLGLSLPDNFRSPYAATGFSDFWRRWHISLSSWLRDYLYVPLGGNRKGKLRTYFNLMVTMLLGGLWHGASWTFVVWGGLHGVYLAVERLLKDRFGDYEKTARLWLRPLLWLVPFVLVLYAWVFFRATTFERAFTIVSAMTFGGANEPAKVLTTTTDLVALWIIVPAIVCVQLLCRDKPLHVAVTRVPRWAGACGLAFVWTIQLVLPENDRAFIYFQF